jgi:tetratricopeptide (TPR) repeat protein
MSGGHHFVSYSPHDATDFVLQLTDALETGSPPLQLWLDRRNLRPGNWDIQVTEAIRTCDTLLFVMTYDSVHHNSVCKEEWTLALRYKKPIIPLKLHPEAELPFRLGSRQYIDFTGEFHAALAKLRLYLEWLASPEGILQSMKDRLVDAQRDSRHATHPHQEMRIRDEITLLEQQITQQQRVVEDPEAIAQRLEESIAYRLERERQPEKLITVVSHSKFINPAPGMVPSYFQDRHLEIRLVAAFLQDDAARLMTIIGRGGIGKTAMVCRLLKGLEHGQLPDGGGSLSVDGIIYLNAIGSRRVSAPNLYADLCRLLPDETAEQLATLFKNPHVGTEDKMRALLTAIPQGRFIVLLDNFEDLLDPQTRDISDTELDEVLRALLTLPHNPIKVILTTRIAPRALALVQPARQKGLHLDDGLKSPDAENILRMMDADGKLGLQSAPAELLHEACVRTQGYPRALEALYAILAADRDTSLQEILSDTASMLPETIVEVLVGEAFSRLDAPAQQVMQALAIYGRPVKPAAIDYLLQPYLLNVNSAPVLTRLVNMQLVRKEIGQYYLHPVDREYALSRLPKGEVTDRDQQEALPFTQFALLHRGADYFKQIRTPRETWKRIEDLEPLLAEIELSYRGQNYDRAAGVLLEIDFDYLFLWGYSRLMAEQHERLEGKLSNLQLKQASLGRLGDAYRVLARYQQSATYLEQALVIAREVGDLSSQGRHLANLGLSNSNLGRYQQAVTYLEQALAIAREVGDLSSQARHLGHLGNRYFELGRLSVAITYHEEALAVTRQIGDRYNEEDQLGLLGRVYCELGDMGKALYYLEDALAMDREMKNRVCEGWRLSDLGVYYSRLGQIPQATYYYEQALMVAREVGERFLEGIQFANFAELLIDEGKYEEAIQRALDCQKVGRETGSSRLGYLGNSLLALAYLYAGNLPRARVAGEASHRYDEPRDNHSILALLGVIALRQGDRAVAREMFTAAVQQVDVMLAYNKSYFFLDSKGLALCGLALCGNKKYIPVAIKVYKEARKIANEPGVTGRVQRLFDALAQADGAAILNRVRATAISRE